MKPLEKTYLLANENICKDAGDSVAPRTNDFKLCKKVFRRPSVTGICFLFALAFLIDFIVSSNYLFTPPMSISNLPDSPNTTRSAAATLFVPATNLSNICIHPKIDKFDPEIMKFYKSPPVCNGTKENITAFISGRLVNNEPMKYNCWGRCLWFKTNKENREGSWQPTSDNLTYDCDIIEVSCMRKGGSVFRRFLRWLLQLFWRSWTDEYAHLYTQIVEQQPRPPKYKPLTNQYSVYFIVVDSHSYTQHNLPKTNEFLLKDMEAITFPYMNRVGLGSRMNAIAWWFGKLTEAVDRRGYNLSSIRVEPEWATTVNCERQLDNETMLIKEFADYGYVTNLAEDWWGTIDYECAGFKNLVSHHTYMPYVLEYEKNEELRERLEKNQCLYRHQHLLDYSTQFIQAYKDKPKMLWTWIVHIGHNNEYLSKELDPHLLEFFKKNKQELENSFVFLGGDHGLRFTDAVKTKVGNLDINNPLLMMTLPKELRERRDLVEAIRNNAKELQTHFDTRATLLDILKYQPSVNFEARTEMNILGEFGHSFLRKQPMTRNCRSLPIPLQYCMCENHNLNINLIAQDISRANRIGQRLVASINKRLRDNGLENKCMVWNYIKVELLTLVSESPFSVQGLVDARTDNHEGESARFNAFGYGRDEFTFELAPVDRINTYGTSGDCAPKEFRPICMCR